MRSNNDAAFYKILNALSKSKPFLSTGQAVSITKSMLFKQQKEKQAKITLSDSEWEDMMSALTQ